MFLNPISIARSCFTVLIQVLDQIWVLAFFAYHFRLAELDHYIDLVTERLKLLL